MTVAAVVITRPRAQAETFAPRISAIGLQPVVFPLLDIYPLDDVSALQATLQDLAAYALVVFVSPNAIDAAFRHMEVAGWPAGVAIGIVGAGSRAALARHGLDTSNSDIFAPLSSEKTDSEGLLAALDLGILRGRRVLIVRGQDGRDFLSDALRKAGVTVEHVSAYRRSAPLLDAAAASQLQHLLAIDSVWIVTSSEALGNLMEMLGQLAKTADPYAVAKMQQKRIVVPHPRIAETARLAGFSYVTLTGSGDERLLAALQSET